jgi:hypothetical protein
MGFKVGADLIALALFFFPLFFPVLVMIRSPDDLRLLMSAVWTSYKMGVLFGLFRVHKVLWGPACFL